MAGLLVLTCFLAFALPTLAQYKATIADRSGADLSKSDPHGFIVKPTGPNTRLGMVVPVADMEPVLKSYSPASSETLLLDLVYPNRIVQGMYRDIGSVWVARSAETGKYYLSVGQDDWRYHFQILKTGEVAGTNHRIGLRYWRPELVSQSYLDLQYQLDKNSNERLWAEHQQAIAQPGGQDALAKERELLADPARLVVGTALDELSLPKAGSGSDGDAAERLNEFPQKDGRRQGNVRHIAETVKEVA